MSPGMLFAQSGSQNFLENIQIIKLDIKGKCIFISFDQSTVCLPVLEVLEYYSKLHMYSKILLTLKFSYFLSAIVTSSTTKSKEVIVVNELI